MTNDRRNERDFLPRTGTHEPGPESRSSRSLRSSPHSAHTSRNAQLLQQMEDKRQPLSRRLPDQQTNTPPRPAREVRRSHRPRKPSHGLERLESSASLSGSGIRLSSAYEPNVAARY